MKGGLWQTDVMLSTHTLLPGNVEVTYANSAASVIEL
jgi:hypothetical protein